MGFPPLENSDHVVILRSCFMTIARRGILFQPTASDCSRTDSNDFLDHAADVLRENLCSLDASAGASEFDKLDEGRIDVYTL